MGEYAKRASDGVEVKIGTCEAMYYLRFEDRDASRSYAASRETISRFPTI